MTGQDDDSLTQPDLPQFDVRLRPPDLAPWLAGNTGVAGFTSFVASEPGPHVALVALTHGNELAGGIVLDHLLRQGIRPARGTLTVGFANIAAFSKFDPAQPTASRFVDEDLNRVWDVAVLNGTRDSCETRRARAMRPLIDSVDILLDLHSMLWPSDPLLLCGMTEKGRDLALSIGIPELIVADRGHFSGRRLMDYGRFADPKLPAVANLLESGQHWLPESVALTEAVIAALLAQTGVQPNLPQPNLQQPNLQQPVAPRRTLLLEVTHAINASTAGFAFVQFYRGGDVIGPRNTLIAMDGTLEIRTPYDDCLLVMPALRPSRGHIAVRLARFVVAPAMTAL